MPYATWQDMVARFGADEMQDLDPSHVAADPDAEPPVDENYPRAAVALDDAAAEIDASLARYALPLPGSEWPLLKRIACDLARAALYDDSVPDAVKASAAAVREMLKSLRDGELTLMSSMGVEPPAAGGAGGAAFRGPDQVMTAENLEGLS